MRIILNEQERNCLRMEAERAGVLPSKLIEAYTQTMTANFGQDIYDVLVENFNELRYVNNGIDNRRG